MIEIKRVLFPIDFSENSSKILPYVLSVSEKYESTIYLLHVIEKLPTWSSGIYMPNIPWDQYQDEALKGAEKTLDGICEDQLQGCPNFQPLIVLGDPAQQILKTIENKKGGLL